MFLRNKKKYDQHWPSFILAKDRCLANSLPASSDICRLLTVHANSLDPDQDRHNLGPDLNTSFLSLE